MPTLKEACDFFSDRLAFDKAHVNLTARRLREAKLLPKQEGKLGGADITADHAVALLLGVMATDNCTETVDRVNAYARASLGFVDAPGPSFAQFGWTINRTLARLLGADQRNSRSIVRQVQLFRNSTNAIAVVSLRASPVSDALGARYFFCSGNGESAYREILTRANCAYAIPGSYLSELADFLDGTHGRLVSSAHYDRQAAA